MVGACSLLFSFAAAGSTELPPTDGPEFLDDEYIVDSWQTDQGLPDNYVNGITQTPDGYIWVATFNGLARFNGVDFVVFDSASTPELPSSRITRVHADRNGRLWILSEYGHLSSWGDGVFHAFPERIRLLRQDYSGTVWTAGGFDRTNYYYFTNGAFASWTSTNTFYERFGSATDFAGHGWGVRDDCLFSVPPAEPVRAPIPRFDASFGWRLVGSQDRGIWAISQRVQKFRDGVWDDYGPLPVPTKHLAERMMEDRDGNLWIGTGIRELWRLGANRVFQRFTLQNSTAAELGKSMFQDAEGNLWVGTGGSGLLRLKPLALKTYGARHGLKSDVVRSVTQDRDGNVWLATVNSVDWFPADSPAQAEPRGLTVSLPWKVYGARNGTVWIGAFSKGLLRVHGDDRRWFLADDRHEPPTLNVIFEDRRGELHLGTPEGLYGIDSDSLVKVSGPDNLEAMDIRAIAEDTGGRLYLGLNGEGLLRRTGSAWERFTTEEGLPGNHVWALYMDRDDAAWIGLHGHGLSRFKDGRFFDFSAAIIELPRIINDIIEDDLGQLWFSSNQGLYRASRSQLNDLAAGRAGVVDITHYSRADGMGSSQCTGSAWKAQDGKLWFATMGGVTVVDPRALPFNSRPPPAVIEQVLIDDRIIADTAPLRNAVSVPVGARRLEFRFAGLSFTVPQRVRFQYRLEGFDKDWVRASGRREASYTRVPPGEYRFQVIASNNDNVWSKTAASIKVSVLPAFWQTTWFPVLILMLILIVIVSLHKVRVSQLSRERLVQENFSRRLIESQENERKRMAAELHDSLGQGLLVVKNYAFMGLRETATPEKMREQLREISDTTSTSIEEVRSIARALRPYQLDRFGLTQTLEDAADLLAKAGSLRIETQIDNVDDAFSAEAQISIFRVVQEWLNNVVKHARASTARLTVRKDGTTVRMVLEDNGVGFDPAAVMSRPGSFGLANLRERVRLLGGALRIDSAPGKGTRLSVLLERIPK